MSIARKPDPNGENALRVVVCSLVASYNASPEAFARFSSIRNEARRPRSTLFAAVPSCSG